MTIAYDFESEKKATFLDSDGYPFRLGEGVYSQIVTLFLKKDKNALYPTSLLSLNEYIDILSCGKKEELFSFAEITEPANRIQLSRIADELMELWNCVNLSDDEIEEIINNIEQSQESHNKTFTFIDALKQYAKNNSLISVYIDAYIQGVSIFDLKI